MNPRNTESGLADKIVKHFREAGISENKVYIDPKNNSALYFTNIHIELEVHDKNTTIALTPPKGTEEKFGEHLKWIQNRVFYKNKDYQKMSDNVRRWTLHLRKGRFTGYTAEDGKKTFYYEGKFASRNPKKAFESVLECVVKPVLLFPRRYVLHDDD